MTSIMSAIVDSSVNPIMSSGRRAIDEDRVVVTINAGDFVRLAEREDLHPGLLTFPSGSRPDEQLALIMRAIERLVADRGHDLMNCWLDIRGEGDIRVSTLGRDPY